MNYFYFDQNNQKLGPVTEQQLKELAAQGVITAHTQMETDTGHKGVAGQIPGMTFGVAALNPPPSSIPEHKTPENKKLGSMSLEKILTTYTVGGIGGGLIGGAIGLAVIGSGVAGMAGLIVGALIGAAIERSIKNSKKN